MKKIILLMISNKEIRKGRKKSEKSEGRRQ